MEELPEAVLSAELGPSERLLWSGKPRGGIRFRSQDMILVPFSLIWCGFAIVWEMMAVTGRTPIFFKLWGIPFVIFGLYFVFGRFFADALARSRTLYGVTNERVMILNTLFGRRVRSISLRGLSDISMSQGSDDTGTITLGPSQPVLGPRGRSRYSPPALEFIDNVKSVHQLIIDTHKKLLSA